MVNKVGVTGVISRLLPPPPLTHTHTSYCIFPVKRPRSPRSRCARRVFQPLYHNRVFTPTSEHGDAIGEDVGTRQDAGSAIRVQEDPAAGRGDVFAASEDQHEIHMFAQSGRACRRRKRRHVCQRLAVSNSQRPAQQTRTAHEYASTRLERAQGEERRLTGGC